MGSRGRAVTDIAGNWHNVVKRLTEGAVPFAVIAPSSVKRYATGSGSAPKERVLVEAVRRLPGFSGSTTNEADAAWLAAMALDHLGMPLATMPKLNRTAMDVVQWPPTRPVPRLRPVAATA
jgi:Holliday junction resolvasome RuvABC endonuclease subunit